MQQRPRGEPILPELEEPEPVISFNSRVVALRTTLGRSAIGLDVRGIATDVVRSSMCDVPEEERIQKGCVRCELAGEGDPFDDAVLETLLAAFDRYPTDVLEATHIEKVALCRKLDYEDIPSQQGRVAGTVDLRARRLFVSIAPFLDREYDPEGDITTDDIVHHELFHLFEYERMRENFNDDQEWRVYNPLGFEYRTENEDEPRKPGFINSYAATADIEDRASMFQYLLARPNELCSLAVDDPTLQTKTRVLWRRISSLIGPTFLAKRAPCVLEWLTDNRSAKANEEGPTQLRRPPAQYYRSLL